MRALRAALVVFLAPAFFASEAGAACYVNDPARFACMELQNNYSAYVTAYYDGNNYGCNTAPGTTCSFVVSVGTHSFSARSNDGKSTNFGTGYVKPGCCDADHRLVVWEVR
jgi:hypothetical protein